MPRPLKRGLIGASMIILFKDIDKYAFMSGSNFYFHSMKILQFWKLPNLVLVYSNNSYTTRLVLSRSSLSGLSSGHHNGSMYPACFRGRSLSLGRGWGCKLARLHSHHPQLLYISTLFFCFFSSKLQRKRPTIGKSVCKVFKMETTCLFQHWAHKTLGLFRNITGQNRSQILWYVVLNM